MEREQFWSKTKKLAGTALVVSPLLSGCTPDQALSMVGAGVISTILIGSGIIMYISNGRDIRKNENAFQRKLQRAVQKHGNDRDVLRTFAQIDEAARTAKIDVLLRKK